MMRPGVFVSLPLVIVMAACLPSARDFNIRGCNGSLATFERFRCAGAPPVADQAHLVDFEYQSLRSSCRDPANQPHIAALATCVARYHEVVTARDLGEEQIRQRFAAQLAELKADPTYQAAHRIFKDARDEAQLAREAYEQQGMPIRSPYERRMESKRKQFHDAEDRLRSIIEQHGIEAQYSQILGVW
jgi:transcriptional regulator of acetoin/glycerol metabolism